MNTQRKQISFEDTFEGATDTFTLGITVVATIRSTSGYEQGKREPTKSTSIECRHEKHGPPDRDGKCAACR